MGALICLLRGLVGFLGRLAGQVLGARRDLDNKRRELCLQVLVDAWRNIERAAKRTTLDEMRGLEQALADIQLFGTPAQADHAARVARSPSGAPRARALGELLEALRVDIRREMRVGPAVTPLVCLRSDEDATAPEAAARHVFPRGRDLMVLRGGAA